MNEIWIIRSLGIIFILFSITFRMGYWKKLYWASRGGIYGYLPLGLVFLLYSFFDELLQSLPHYTIVFYGLFVFLLLMGLYLTWRKPRWIKPAWVLWVEKYPQKIRNAMLEDVKLGDEWEVNTRDEQSVDQWAKKLAQRRKTR